MKKDKSKSKWIRDSILTFPLVIATSVLAYLIALDSPLIYKASGGFVGGGAPSNILFYDVDGKGHNILNIGEQTYQGPAPLYRIEPDAWTKLGVELDDIGRPLTILPEIPADFVMTHGEEIYPITIVPSVQTWVRSGESIRLDVDIGIRKQFKGTLGMYNLMNWDVKRKEQVVLLLNAPNFEFSPDNENPSTLTFGLETPIQYSWVIAPKENAAGNQIMSIEMVQSANRSERLVSPMMIEIEVRPLIGIDPVLLGVITAFGSLILWSMTIYKLFLDTQKKNSDPVSSPSSIPQSQSDEGAVR